MPGLLPAKPQKKTPTAELSASSFSYRLLDLRQTVSYTHLEAAGQFVLAAADEWDKHELYFGTMLRHDELDEVVGSFATLQAYLACEDGDEFLSTCAQLIRRLEHICDMEQPLPANIL